MQQLDKRNLILFGKKRMEKKLEENFAGEVTIKAINGILKFTESSNVDNQNTTYPKILPKGLDTLLNKVENCLTLIVNIEECIKSKAKHFESDLVLLKKFVPLFTKVKAEISNLLEWGKEIQKTVDYTVSPIRKDAERLQKEKIESRYEESVLMISNQITVMEKLITYENAKIKNVELKNRLAFHCFNRDDYIVPECRIEAELNYLEKLNAMNENTKFL